LDEARRIMCRILDIDDRGESPLSEVHAGILGAWRRAAADPDDLPETWFECGAPAGVARDIEDRGIFEAYDPVIDARTMDPSELATESEFVNYAGVEADELVNEEVHRLTDAHWMHKFDTIEGAAVYLECNVKDIVLSKIGVIAKMRLGKLKKRVVIDAKRSGISSASRKFQRVLLPRATDVIVDILEMLWASWDGSAEDFEFFILDFTDAFFHIPLHRSEQRYFVVSLRGSIFVLLRTAQGSRGAPLTWARSVALLARLTQAMFKPEAVRINVYVDDPIIGLRGKRRTRDINAAMIIIVWSALGFSLSFRKAKRASAVTWTSVHFAVVGTPDDFTVVAQSKPELVEDAWQLTKECLASNVVSRKSLRTLAGKVTHIASLIFVLRAFVSELWAAIYSDATTWAPNGCIWVSQIRMALVWLNAFFEASGSRVLTRHFSALAMFNSAGVIEMVMDASPWGLGAALFMSGRPVEYFCSIVDENDASILGVEIGSCKAQQTVEALTVLVAYRCWSKVLDTSRCTIRVKSDSISALYLVSSMTSKGHGSKIIARELALLFAMQCHRPDILEHIPGVSNKLADALSRRYEPGFVFERPEMLASATEIFPEKRVVGYYRALCKAPMLKDTARQASGEKRGSAGE